MIPLEQLSPSKAADARGSVLVYTATRGNAEKAANLLQIAGIGAPCVMSVAAMKAGGSILLPGWTAGRITRSAPCERVCGSDCQLSQ